MPYFFRVFSNTRICRIVIAIALYSTGSANAQQCVTRQRIISHLSIGGTVMNPRFTNLFELTPPGYNPLDNTKKYPVIIYFPGNQASTSVNQAVMGDTVACAMIYDQPTSLPGKIEARRNKDSVFFNGVWYKFIFLSFQYNRYDYPGNDFPSGKDVEAALNYALANYRADPQRIYMTGMSAGANMPLEFAGSNSSRPRRIAAISMASDCSQVGVRPNDTVNAPANIASSGLATWFMACTSDGTCPPNFPINISHKWVDSINVHNPLIVPQLTVLTGSSGSLACEGFAHNTWNKMYDSSFRVNGKNFYEWVIQFSADAALPVVFKEFSARLDKGKVYLKWTTELETGGGAFTIEKAGTDQRFSALYSLTTSGSSSREKTYEFVDDKPLANISYYRIAQSDPDGRKQYFETRRVFNRENNKVKLFVSPNPFASSISAFVTVSRTQRVQVSISDMSGRRVFSLNNTYNEGSTEIPINVSFLTRGVYLLKAEGDDFSETQRIVKQ